MRYLVEMRVVMEKDPPWFLAEQIKKKLAGLQKQHAPMFVSKYPVPSESYADEVYTLLSGEDLKLVVLYVPVPLAELPKDVCFEYRPYLPVTP